ALLFPSPASNVSNPIGFPFTDSRTSEPSLRRPLAIRPSSLTRGKTVDFHAGKRPSTHQLSVEETSLCRACRAAFRPGRGGASRRAPPPPGPPPPGPSPPPGLPSPCPRPP